MTMLATITRHTCGGPQFGRLSPDCARCRELSTGAPRRQWSSTKRTIENARFLAALKAHDCKKSGCLPICTFGDW